jgi:hypothetical protein
MKYYLFIAMLVTSLFVNAQEAKSKIEQFKDSYMAASKEERAKMEPFALDLENFLKQQQIQTIGGIPFGISREKASEMLRNKFGEPTFDPSSTTISFENIKYAGVDFDNAHFLFQSDGVNSYLNECIFVKNTKTKEEAIIEQEYLRSLLSQKYVIDTLRIDTGINIYSGGISPLWDGHWYDLNSKKIVWHLI